VKIAECNYHLSNYAIFPRTARLSNFPAELSAISIISFITKPPSADTQLTNCIQLDGNSAKIAACKSFKLETGKEKKKESIYIVAR